MSDEISISQEQADMLDQAMPVALEALLGEGTLVPTLYVHDGSEVTVFNLAMESQEALHAAVRSILAERFPTALAYVLAYDATIDTDEGPTDVLILETGDSEDDEAHELARAYSREDGESDPNLVRLGAAPRLFRPA